MKGKFMDNQFQSILITGASSGIGKSLALALAASNVALHLTGRNEERLNLVVEECIKKGAMVKSSLMAVEDYEAMKQQIQQWDDEQPLDLVIANAGIAGNHIESNNVAERLRLLMDTNVTGVLNTIEPVIERMTARKKGQIALMGSMASFLPLPPSPAYCATKSMLLNWGDSIGPNLAKDQLYISVICPGFVRSHITDQNQFPMPFFMEGEKAAHIIIKGLKKRKPRIAFPFALYGILSFLSILPRILQRFILTKLPHKE